VASCRRKPSGGVRPDELGKKLDELRTLTDAVNRDFDDLVISYKAPLYDSSSPFMQGKAKRPFTGEPQAIIADIETFSALGVSELIFDFRHDSINESLERMEYFVQSITSPG